MKTLPSQILHTSIKRLLIVPICILLFLFIGGHFTNTHAAVIFGWLSSILASPYGEPLARWVNGVGTSTPHESPSGGSVVATSPDTSPVGTVFIIFLMNFYALAFMKLLTVALVGSIDEIDNLKLVSFTDLGYMRVQIYVAGYSLLATWFPAASVCAGTLALRGRLSFGTIAAGTMLGLITYYLGARALGIAVGDSGPMLDGLATYIRINPTFLHSRAGQISVQVCALVFLCLCASVYMWTVGGAARLFVNLFSKLTKLTSRAFR